MNNNLPLKVPLLCRAAATVAGQTLLALGLAFGTVTSVHAQGQIASGTVSGSGTGPYTYNLTFSDAAGATSPIGSVWYAWVPGFFYLPGTPSSASAPSGWSANLNSTANSVQFTANSPANYIMPGQTLSGFSYIAAFTPAQLAAAPNSGRSDAYSGALFSDAGNIFIVSTVPEPSSLALLVSGGAVFWVVARRKSRAN